MGLNYTRATRGGFIEPSASHFTAQATSEQLAEICRLGGRPPSNLTRTQAAVAINTLRWRRSKRARLTAPTPRT